MHKNVHSSTVCNSPRLKTTQMLIHKRAQKYSAIECYTAVRTKELHAQHNTYIDESHKVK